MSLTKIATIVFALTIATFGVTHLRAGEGMAGLVPSWLPGGGTWVYITGVCLILAAISILIGKFTRIACLLLALMLIGFVLTIHLPHLMGGDQMSMGSLLKDTAMAMAALMIADRNK
ncbi:MAG: DoxX family membrane protein [Sphingobacteriales bacterium]